MDISRGPERQTISKRSREVKERVLLSGREKMDAVFVHQNRSARRIANPRSLPHDRLSGCW